MSYDLHIPIDDIAEEDLEADLREVAQFGHSHKQQPTINGASSDIQNRRRLEFRPRFNPYPIPVIGVSPSQNYVEQWGKNTVNNPILGSSPKKGEEARAQIGTGFGVDNTERIQVGGRDRVISDADLEFARHDIETGRDRLFQDEMKEKLESVSKAHSMKKQKEITDIDEREKPPIIMKEESKKKNVNKGVEESNTDADLDEKSNFVNLVKKNNRQRLQNEVSSTESPNKFITKLLSDLKSLRDEKKSKNLPKASNSDENPMNESKPVEEDDQEKSFPYENKKLDKNNSSQGKPKNGPWADGLEEKNQLARIDSKMVKDLEPTKGKSRKPKKKGKHHKKPTFGKETQLDNDAVAYMAAVDRSTNNNQTAALFTLVDKGKDRVDLPLTDTDKAWTHKVHGHRDIVVAGAIVMCLGLAVIIASLISMVRRRFIKSAKRKINKNNNRRQRVFGSASETELLRKPQKSLFPTASSDNDDDDDDDNSGEDTSTSGEEIIYHQKRVSKHF